MSSMPVEMTSHTLVEKLYADLAARVQLLIAAGHTPALAVVLVGNDPSSERYVASIKRKQAESIGILYTIHRLDATANEATVIDTIEKLNLEVGVTGIIVQLPLSEGLNVETILGSVAKEKDVDGLRQGTTFMPPTVRSILELFEAYDIQLADKKIAIVGHGRLVGAPLYSVLKGLKLDVSTCDASVADLKGCTLGADILICATGHPKLIEPSMVKEGAVIVDVDTDVNYDAVAAKASYITPQRGGVGPLTVTFLLANVIEAAEALSRYDNIAGGAEEKYISSD